MNAKANEILATAREKKGYTQTEMAQELAIHLKQTYSLRQYQRLEDGEFPKFKTQVIKAVDEILGTNLYDIIYDSKSRDEIAPPYLEQRRLDKMTNEPFMVPMVHFAARAGYAESYDNTDFIQTLDHFPILPNVSPTGLTWRYFEISGYSMEPELSNKDIVLCSLVNREDWRDLKPFYTYVIVTENDVYAKRIYRDKGTWYLLSAHRPSGHKKLSTEDVREVWAIRRHIRSKIPVSENFDIEEIKKQLGKK